MADPVEARLDVSLEDPAGTAPVAQDDVALLDGVCRRSFLPEPLRVRVGHRLRDGIKGLQVEACIARSLIVGIPRGRILPFFLGMYTRLNGWGL